MGLLKKAESFEKKQTVPQIQEIDGKKYYSAEELSKLTGKTAGAILMKLTRDSSIGVLVNNFRYFSQEDIQKLKGDGRTNIQKQINGLTYYSTKELANLLGMTEKSVSVKIAKTKIGTTINHFRYFSKSDIEKLKPKRVNPLARKSVNKKVNVNSKSVNSKRKTKANKKMFWKISEYNNDLNVYVVKICSLSEEKAKFLESVWISQGRYVRATPHLTRL